MEIPRVKFDIDENNPLSGVKTLSLVESGAIESDFIFFSKQKPKQKFVELKGEKYKQVVAGLALIPDKDILRYDDKGDAYYGFFTVDSIERIRNKFHKEQMTSNVNTDHSSTNYIDAFLIESFIVDSAERLADVKARGIDEATIGSWFVAYKIEDAEIFKKVVSGELNGFSVEIFLQKFHKVEDNNTNKLEKMMNKFLEKFKQLLAEAEKEETPAVVEEKKLETAKTNDGNAVEYGAVGEAVTVDGQPAPDGEHTLDNGKVITVASGVLTAINDAPAPEDQKKEEAPANAELEKAKADLAKVEGEKAELAKELEKIKGEVEKLKKAPLVKPVVKTEPKVQVDVSKLSAIEKIAHKNGVTISPMILKKLNNK